MGVTKTDVYSKEQNELATILKALGHPARLAIIQQLLSKKCCICGDFTHEIPLAQPTISRHLKELKAIGIIAGTVEGSSISYCINAQRWQEIQAMCQSLFNSFSSDITCSPAASSCQE